MVLIAERIWRVWRAQAEEFDEPAILLMLHPVGDPKSALRAVAESVGEITAACAGRRWGPATASGPTRDSNYGRP